MGGKKEGLLNLKINGRESHSSVSSVNEAELIPLDMNNNPMTKMTSNGVSNNCGELVLRKARHLEDDDDTSTSTTTTKLKRNGSGGSGGGAGGSIGHINLNDDEDDDEVEDLAKMISCFALLMPNRITAGGSDHRTPTASTLSSSSSSSNGSAAQSSSNARQDIMITAAAAASALGMGQIKRTSSSLFSRLGKNT